jgi:hypothetical protein
MPDYLIKGRKEEILSVINAKLPETYRGHSLLKSLSGGAGLALDSLEGYLKQTIGIDYPPKTYEEWLSIPEEDIIHVINGEIWYDEAGCFSAIRKAFHEYYPEPVRLRRIAHWCRFFSGMGTYAVHRAILRNNEYYASVAFGKAIRWGIQLAFMLDKEYYPYDKWIMSFLPRLPRLGGVILPLANEANKLSTSWERKVVLLDEMADVLDQAMVADGLIKSHPKFQRSPTSGYRLLESAYVEIAQQLPPELLDIIPTWDQTHWERMHINYVAGIELEYWREVLNLIPVENDS